ncbi:MAG: hypothetical protein ACI4V2_04260 [Alloprevotella sp.]
MPTDRLTERFAVSRLHLPGGEVLKNQVVEVWQAADGSKHYSYYDLERELPFTMWRGGDFWL